MTRTKKPGAYPDWLYDPQHFPPATVLWLCSACKGPSYRPYETAHDRPIPFVGPCWRSREYGVKCVTDKGARVEYVHDRGWTIEPHENIEPPDKWDHANCASHFRHPGFRRRICVLPGQTIAEVRAFADEITGLGIGARDEAKGTRRPLGRTDDTQLAGSSAST